MHARFLTALPVFNEVKSVSAVLDEVVRYSDNILVVDDGSTDGTRELLRQRNDIVLLEHDVNRGYGGALITAFDYATDRQYPYLVTIDCDGQHEPQRIRQFVSVCHETAADIVSGSRYLSHFPDSSAAPQDRQEINREVTGMLNQRLGFELTDAFCGFKAYKVESLRRLKLTEFGYAMPLELWVQAWQHQLKVVELAVPLIYLDEDRSFGDDLNDPEKRLAYYQDVLCRSFEVLSASCPKARQREQVG